MKIAKFWLLPLIALLCIISGCRIYTLDSFYFDPESVDEYFQPEDIEDWYHIRWIIPDTLIEPVVLNANGNAVYAFFVKAPDTIINPITVIFSNGKDKNINRYWGWVEILWECGYNVFIYDYEGYGKSEGTPSDKAFYRDKQKSIDYVSARTDIDTLRIVYMGLSIGTYVTVYGAADYKEPALVILESP
ncbi:alpha/beta hydrolase, partial [candidate division WOR-3 bacterium]|nr:alpha/beta hydrolase [candidate division WOR-3 bacterium]